MFLEIKFDSLFVRLLLTPFLIFSCSLLASCQTEEQQEPTGRTDFTPFYNTTSAWADSLLKNMTLDEKVGQLFMVLSLIHI